MRRKVGLVLVALGVFLVVLAPLARFYAYPKLAVAPADQNSVTTLFGPNANIFDAGSLSNMTTDLTTTVGTVGDVKAADEAGGNTVVWVSTSSTKDSGGVARTRSVDRVGFNANTGEAVNCCGEYYESVAGEQEPVKHKGLVFKFPFDTQKTEYQFWDSTLLKALPIKYAGVGDVDGVTVYKFAQDIGPTVSSTSEVPASVLKLTQTGNVEADMMYANIRTLWVEPNTGVILKRTEQQHNTIRYQGEDRLVTTDVTTGYDDATIKENADKYGALGSQLHLVKSIVPLGGLILGLLLLVIGLVLTRSAPGRRTA